MHPELSFLQITYREMKLLSCEASWTSFSQCPSLLQLMTALQKNALVLYSKLRQTCREDGHTYIKVKDLTWGLSEHMSFEEACQSLDFLRTIDVITYEKDFIFLSELYQAEHDIASFICELMNRPPWHLKVDVRNVLASIGGAKSTDSGSTEAVEGSKPDEVEVEVAAEQGDSVLGAPDSGDHVRSNGEHVTSAEINRVPLDRDQVVALETICTNAVTVLSGKGGCGKTTIVSRLFKHVEQLEEREVQQACEDFEQDQGASEEWLDFPKQSPAGVDKAIEVLLTAPTGKAAGLLRQKTHLPAYTLCQVKPLTVWLQIETFSLRRLCSLLRRNQLVWFFFLFVFTREVKLCVFFIPGKYFTADLYSQTGEVVSPSTEVFMLQRPSQPHSLTHHPPHMSDLPLSPAFATWLLWASTAEGRIPLHHSACHSQSQR